MPATETFQADQAKNITPQTIFVMRTETGAIEALVFSPDPSSFTLPSYEYPYAAECEAEQ